MTRLNLACGDDRREGWINIDFREDVADLVADVSDLKGIEDDSVDEILASDILEHFPVFRIPDVLDEWRRVLRPGGLLILRVPNLLVLARLIVEGQALKAVIRNIYGGHRWGQDGNWDAHHTGWVPNTLSQTLEQAGFEILSNDEAANMTVRARKR